MLNKAPFVLKGRNPDILNCIANLSNDEVFTPPELANQMLDTLEKAWADNHNGADIWADSRVTFLDPCAKSGVFLREISKRLVKGLEKEIPDLQQRVDHILINQIFGIGITLLTSYLSRRSLYCSKNANGEHSITKAFSKNEGNIWFQKLDHSWENGKCKYCGAPESILNRDEDCENYAYAFIHTQKIEDKLNEIFENIMQFDVIIGNPPYQLKDDSGSASASPIYQKFIEQAIALNPYYISMITPSRWFVGGKGLDQFRDRMLKDNKIRSIVDFIVEKDAFPNVNINGGVSYFLWDRSHNDNCEITTIEAGGVPSNSFKRSLSEFDVFIRRNKAVPILRKVLSKKEFSYNKLVYPRKPFGLPSNYKGSKDKTVAKNIKLIGASNTTWISNSEITNNNDLVKKWKVLIGRATDGNENYPLPIWDKRGPIISGPGEACTETYLVAGIFESRKEASKAAIYMSTVFFRFLVSLRKITQDNKADVFSFVPNLGFQNEYTDLELIKRYSISEDEFKFMKEIIREMDFSG